MLTSKDLIFGFLAITALIGLLGLSVYDQSAKDSFLKVAEWSLAAYLGYFIPNK
ncbi:hypothetical protein [Scytonema sp. NUACC26]|uniref:hypothetical protein n=1 Tax=Scytonema sp. NUACC26 TaxID=3140176 RepID=UPI0034DBDFDA